VFGWTLEETAGDRLDFYIPAEDWPETQEMVVNIRAGEAIHHVETYRLTKQGEKIPVVISGSAFTDRNGKTVGTIINLRDVREQRYLQAQLDQSKKMEAIGTLAGGIAHDFNNILSAIIGYSELARHGVEKGSLLYENLQAVLSAGIRARDLVQQILTFSRQSDQERKPVEVGLICKVALKFLRASLPTTIEIRQDIRSKSLIMADPTQIHQVLMNLCANGAHAMREKGGILDVKLEEVELDEKFTGAHTELNPGPFVKLTVSDTGCGIPANLINQIFNPFFTTKKQGEGTGMGLSVVHGIVGSNGGKILVTSEPGQGSTFTVYLPVHELPSEPRIVNEESVPTGGERILFVDDEPALVDIGKQILESLGYKVTARTGSLEALELFKSDRDRFDLVITDMTMPNMAGDNLAKELMKINPHIPVILCTGYSARIDRKQAEAIGIRAFVPKPVLRKNIAETIRKVLDATDVEVTAPPSSSSLKAV
jgi:PAS domain S-box-containing protein